MSDTILSIYDAAFIPGERHFLLAPGNEPGVGFSVMRLLLILKGAR